MEHKTRKRWFHLEENVAGMYLCFLHKVAFEKSIRVPDTTRLGIEGRSELAM